MKIPTKNKLLQPIHPGLKRPGRIICYDLETNGKSSIEDRILEIAMIIYDVSSKQTQKYHSLIKIDFNNVELYAYCLTGYTREYLNENGRDLMEVMRETFAIINEEPDTIISGYNINNFDNLFLSKYHHMLFQKPWHWKDKSFDCFIDWKADILNMKDARYKADWRSVHYMIASNNYTKRLNSAQAVKKLADAAIFYGIDCEIDKFHNAQYDTETTFKILQKQQPHWFE